MEQGHKALFEGQRWSRRALLRGSVLGVGGLAAAALLGCGGDDDAVAPIATRTADEEASDWGRLIQDPDLRFPFNFPEPNKEPKAGGIMRVAATWDTSTMDPTKSAAGGTITVPNMVYNRLIGFVGGPDLNPYENVLKPELAASWERTPDGMTYTFNLRDDVTWQDVPPLSGRPFVAMDVKLAYERYGAEGVHQSYWTNVDSIDAPDDHTLVIHLSRPIVDFIMPLASRYQTIFPPELVDNGSIDTAVVGTGPMIMTEAVQSSRVTFVKNPDYWQREVLLDGFEFKIVPDHATRLAGFRAGQFDYAYAVADDIRAIEQLQRTDPDIQINHTLPVNGTIPFGMNLSSPKYQDARIRRAIALAMDTDQMAQVVYDGLAKTLPVLPWVFVFDEEPTVDSGLFGDWWRYDPAEARQLLAAAGAENLTMENQYYAYGAYLERYSEMLVDMFRNAGITMVGGKVDYTQFNSQWVGGSLPDVSTSAWVTQGFDADNFYYNIIHSASPGNRWRLSDPEFDEWAEAQQVEVDKEARRELLRKIWDKALDQMYWPPTPTAIGFQVYQPWVRGIRFGGLLGTSSSFYDWGDQVAAAWLDK